MLQLEAAPTEDNRWGIDGGTTRPLSSSMVIEDENLGAHAKTQKFKLHPELMVRRRD